MVYVALLVKAVGVPLMVHVLLLIDSPDGSEGEAEQPLEPVTGMRLPTSKSMEVDTFVGDNRTFEVPPLFHPVPSPIAPYQFLPQQRILPFSISAQV